MGSLRTVRMTSQAAGRAAISGFHTHHVDSLKFLYADIMALFDTEADFEVWLEAGGFRTAAGPPITEICAVTGSTWTADNNVASRETDADVMRGAYRWVFTNQTAEGFRGTIGSAPSTWDGVTVFCPDFQLVSGVNSVLFGVGSGSTRLQVYVNSAGRLTYNNGTVSGTVQDTSAPLSVGSRYSICASYNNSDDNVNLYVNSGTPVKTASTGGQKPPNSTSGAVGGTADDAVDGNSKFSLCMVLNRAITSDEATSLMAFGQSIRELA